MLRLSMFSSCTPGIVAVSIGHTKRACDLSACYMLGFVCTHVSVQLMSYFEVSYQVAGTAARTAQYRVVPDYRATLSGPM